MYNRFSLSLAEVPLMYSAVIWSMGSFSLWIESTNSFGRKKSLSLSK